MRRPIMKFRPLLVSIALVGLMTSDALAQAQYKTLPVDDTARRLGTIAKRSVTSPTGDANDRKTLDDYIFKYHLPKMTQTDSASLGDLGKMRFELVRSFLAPADPQIASELTKKIFDGMKGIIPSSEYHRAVRYSALILVGQLDALYAKGTTPAKPLPEATTFLTAVVKAGLTKSNVPPELIAGSLIGLQRHARYAAGLPAAQRDDVLATLLAVVNRESLPQDVGRDVEHWITYQACVGLAEFRTPGPNNSIHDALVSAIANETVDIDTRATVAGLLKNIDYATANGIDETKLSATLLGLATAIGTSEANFAEEFEESQIGGGYGAGGSYGFESVDLPSEYKRRRLLARLTSLRTAIAAVTKGLKQDEPKQALAAIDTAASTVLTLAGDAKTLDLDVAAAARTFDSEVKQLATTYGVKAEEEVVEANTEDEEEAEAEAEADAAEAEAAP